jgi:biopolymer transport protein TolQ
MLTEYLFQVAQYGAEAILYFLVFLSVVSLTIILDRFFYLSGAKSKSNKVQIKLEEALVSHHLEDLELIAANRDSIESKALSYGIRYSKENGSNGLAEIFNSYMIMEKQKLEKGLGFLATVGSNAVFIGLLGTVLGIMRAFKDLATSQGNMNVVMTGIAEALVATAVGLLVAIPAVVAYNHFQKQVKRVLSGVESVRELCIAYASQTKRK